MKHVQKNAEDFEAVLYESLQPPPVDVVEEGCVRVFSRLRAEVPSLRLPRSVPARRRRPFSGWRRLAFIPAAAAVALAVFIVVELQQPAFAVVESVNGSVYRITDRTADPVRLGQKLEQGVKLRSDSGAVGALKLSDGARIEMRGTSELLLNKEGDGVLINLNRGGIIVDAANQSSGELRIQTTDLQASIVGSVSLVSSEQASSRLGVIGGHVRVRRGGADQTLGPGEQVVTGAGQTWRPLSEEIAWSPSKETHLALLQQSTSSADPRVLVGNREEFDAVSIRPSIAAGAGGRGQFGGGGNRNSRGNDNPCSNGGEPLLDPQRFDAANVTALQLILWAQGMDCQMYRGSDLLFGAPEWSRHDGFDVKAVIPEGASVYTRSQFRVGIAPGLQKMLQAMLAGRFHLSMHREMREMPAYVLSIENGGPRFTATNPDARNMPQFDWSQWKNPEFSVWSDGDPRELNNMSPEEIHLRKQTITDLVRTLSFYLGRPVLDRTGLSGEYNFFFRFTVEECGTCPFKTPRENAPREPGVGLPTDSIFSLLKKVGLSLKTSREKVDVLVIDRLERPTEN